MSQPNYTGAFTPATANAAVATIAAVSGHPNQFTITAVAAGTTTVTITGGGGQKISYTVQVTTTSVTAS